MSNSKDAVRKILDLVKADKRTSLTAPEGKLVCDAYGIPVPKEGVAKSAAEAATMASSMGFPVVMKIVSPDILHKTEAGGVMVGVKTDRKSTRLNSSHLYISYAVFCLKKNDRYSDSRTCRPNETPDGRDTTFQTRHVLRYMYRRPERPAQCAATNPAESEARSMSGCVPAVRALSRAIPTWR